jgi:hypothetical protein
MLSALDPSVQQWEEVKGNGAYIWGEGWGGSVEEADRMALSCLVSRITVAVTSDFRQVEQQVRSSRGDEHYLMQSHRTGAYSSVTLSNTHRVVLRAGRKAHVGRWIHRDELGVILSDRKARVLEYEAAAFAAEESARVGDALRYHYWAYVLLRSLQRPSELRDSRGRMLLNTIPERLGDLLEGLDVRVKGRLGDTILLGISYEGEPVEGLDFRYFDGARWVDGETVRGGRASLEMAPGAPAETIQLRIEYAYMGDALMDAELHDTMAALELRPMRKAFISLRTR